MSCGRIEKRDLALTEPIPFLHIEIDSTNRECRVANELNYEYNRDGNIRIKALRDGQ